MLFRSRARDSLRWRSEDRARVDDDRQIPVKAGAGWLGSAPARRGQESREIGRGNSLLVDGHDDIFLLKEVELLRPLAHGRVGRPRAAATGRTALAILFDALAPTMSSRVLLLGFARREFLVEERIEHVDLVGDLGLRGGQMVERAPAMRDQLECYQNTK